MKGLKTSGIRNIQKIDKEMGDGTATRKMMDNLGQVGAGVARVAGRTALGTAQSVAAAPGALKMAAKQRKDDVESGVTKKLGSRLGLRKPDAAERKRAQQDRLEKIRDRKENARQKGIRQRAQSIKKAGEVKREREEKGRQDKERQTKAPVVQQKALPPASDRKALPPARSPQKALPGTTGTYAKKPTGSGKVDVNVSSGGIASKGGAMGRDGSQGRSLPAAKEKGTYVGKKYTIRQGSGGSSSSTPTGGGAGSLTRAVDKANNQRAAKRAQTTSTDDYASKAERIAAFKKKRAEQRAAGVKMREELIYEVENMKKEKVDKVIDIMRGKNKVEVNPKISESHLLVQDLADYKPLEIETIDLIKPEPLKASNWRNEISEEDKKIISINKEKRLDAKKQAFKDMVDEPYETDDKKRKEYGKKLLDRLTKVDEGAAWTKKEGKNKSGGLNEKGRKSYERENPGSDLKAPSKKVGNPRRKSFCARMKGMKKKLTSKKTASDPNSRINKSLRAWNC